jgi:hypothetical protein
MRRSFWWRRAGALGFGMVILAAVALVPAAAAQKGVANRPALGELQRAHNATANDEGQGNENEVLARAEQESIMRTAPGSSVSAAAYVAGAAQAAHLGTAGGSWRAITDKPFQTTRSPATAILCGATSDRAMAWSPAGSAP